MGSNEKKHFDRGLREWGSKQRKEEGRSKKSEFGICYSIKNHII